MTETQPSPLRMKASDRAETFVDEADRQINARRTARINPAEISHDLKISRSLLYSYFPDAMALVAAVMDRHCRWLIDDRIEEAAAQDHFVTALIETSLIYLRHAIHRGAAIEICFNDRWVAQQMNGDMRKLIFRLYRRLGSQAAKQLAMPIKDAFNTILILQAIPEEAALLVRRGEISQADAEALCKRLINASIAELTPQSPPHSPFHAP